MRSRLKWDLQGPELQVRKHKGDLCWTSRCLIDPNGRSCVVYNIPLAYFLCLQNDPERQWMAVMNSTSMALYKTDAQEYGLKVQNALRKLCGMEELSMEVLCSFSKRYNREGWGWWEWVDGEAVAVEG